MSKSFFNIREALEIGTDEIVDAYKKATPGEMKEAPEDDMPASPDEASMAMDQAKFIGYVAEEIMEYIQGNNEFPEWMQNKLSALHEKAKGMHAVMAGKYESVQEAKVECPKCKGEGCDHCDGKGYHMDEKYRPATKAEIEADKKKDRAGKKRPSMSAKSAKKSIYKNMMGGLKEEDLQELDAKTQKKFSMGAKNMKAYAQKNGGVDKKDFMDVAKLLDQIARVNLLQAGQLLSRLNRLVDGMDTDVRERIYAELQKVGLVEELEEKKAPKIDDKKFATHMARNKKAKKMTSTQKSLSDIQKRANEEVDERKLTPKEIKKALASSKAKAKPKSQVSLKKAPFEIPESLEEKLQVSDGMKKWIEDFQKSDAPQFEGKDKNERREMAIAAYLAAKRREKKED
jgi:hypothetical protein